MGGRWRSESASEYIRILVLTLALTLSLMSIYHCWAHKSKRCEKLDISWSLRGNCSWIVRTKHRIGDRRWIVRDVSIIYLKNYMRPGDEWKQPPLPTAVKVGEWKSRQLIAIWSNGQEEDGRTDGRTVGQNGWTVRQRGTTRSLTRLNSIAPSIYLSHILRR